MRRNNDVVRPLVGETIRNQCEGSVVVQGCVGVEGGGGMCVCGGGMCVCVWWW